MNIYLIEALLFCMSALSLSLWRRAAHVAKTISYQHYMWSGLLSLLLFLALSKFIIGLSFLVDQQLMISVGQPIFIFKYLDFPWIKEYTPWLYYTNLTAGNLQNFNLMPWEKENELLGFYDLLVYFIYFGLISSVGSCVLMINRQISEIKTLQSTLAYWISNFNISQEDLIKINRSSLLITIGLCFYLLLGSFLSIFSFKDINQVVDAVCAFLFFISMLCLGGVAHNVKVKKVYQSSAVCFFLGTGYILSVYLNIRLISFATTAIFTLVILILLHGRIRELKFGQHPLISKSKALRDYCIFMAIIFGGSIVQQQNNIKLMHQKQSSVAPVVKVKEPMLSNQNTQREVEHLESSQSVNEKMNEVNEEGNQINQITQGAGQKVNDVVVESNSQGVLDSAVANGPQVPQEAQQVLESSMKKISTRQGNDFQMGFEFICFFAAALIAGMHFKRISDVLNWMQEKVANKKIVSLINGVQVGAFLVQNNGFIVETSKVGKRFLYLDWQKDINQTWMYIQSGSSNGQMGREVRNMGFKEILNLRQRFDKQFALGTQTQTQTLNETKWRLAQETLHNLNVSIWQALNVKINELPLNWSAKGADGFQISTRDEKVLHVRVSDEPLEVENRQKTWVLTIEDITERVAHQQHLDQMARIDALTGVKNRRAAMELLKEHLRLYPKKEFGLLFLDLDGFKQINDTYGHKLGDEVLQAVALCFDKAFTEMGGWCARLGGDEFIGVFGGHFQRLERGLMDKQQLLKNEIVKHTLSENEIIKVQLLKAISMHQKSSNVHLTNRAIEVSTHLLNALQDKVKILERSKKINLMALGTSIGVSFYPDEASSVEDLLRIADEKMYELKSISKDSKNITNAERLDQHIKKITNQETLPDA